MSPLGSTNVFLSVFRSVSDPFEKNAVMQGVAPSFVNVQL